MPDEDSMKQSVERLSPIALLPQNIPKNEAVVHIRQRIYRPSYQALEKARVDWQQHPSIGRNQPNVRVAQLSGFGSII